MEPNVNGTFLEIDAQEGNTYFFRTDVLNPADHCYADIHEHNSRGYGGSEFRFLTTTNEVKAVKGPWHSSAPQDDPFIPRTTELHLTKVTLWDGPPTNPDKEPIYDEKEWTLGSFYRGERIAHQLATMKQKPIWFHCESKGGSSSHVAEPGSMPHPLSMRKEDRA